jgi:deoxyribonuclease V
MSGQQTNTAELVARQRELALRVDRRNHLDWPPRRVAAVDCAFPERGTRTRAAAVLFSFPRLECLAEAVSEMPTTLPYIPGLLSFRELPAMLAALEQLPERADVVLCDGQGIAHPRRFGIACHLGVETGLPSVGVGKSRLCGQHEEPGREKGSVARLIDDGEDIGCVVRTRSGVRPLYVSIGHRIDLDSAVRLTLACTGRFRLPEPVRAADSLAGQSSARCSR